MRIEVHIDATCPEPTITVTAAKITPELHTLIQSLSDDAVRQIAGRKDGRFEFLDQADILRLFACNGKVYAVTPKGEYELRLRLYECEERLDKKQFVRISNSEIINLRKTEGFDLNLAGTICVTLRDGTSAYVSRRYIPKIKRLLGL